jgi:hypothetical protein
MLAKFGPVWADFEVTAGKSPAELRVWWGDLLEQAPDAGLYTAESWLGTNVAPTALTAALWVAWWQHAEPPGAPARLWQTTGNAEVPGVPGPVDLDHFLGTAAALEQLFGQAQAPAPVVFAVPVKIAAAANTRSGQGYYLATPAGDVYTFGDALYCGAPATRSPGDLVAILPTPSGRGYRLVTSRGFVGEYGDARPERVRRAP